jgi:SAM-dependent methyltransferase
VSEGERVTAPDQAAFWDRWHGRPRADSSPEHDEFRKRFLALLPQQPQQPQPAILELGCGQGRDAVELATAGHPVHAVDFAANAIRTASAVLPESLRGRVTFRRLDLADPLPFADGAYAAVYSYLSLHYFDDPTTVRIFDEVRRVLRPGGWLGFVVKSVNDRLYGKGDRLGPDRYCLKGHVRHFFSQEYVQRLLARWQELSMDEQKGAYTGAEGVDTFLAVLARRPVVE